MTDAMITVLEGLHHRVSRRLAVLMEGQLNGGEWEWSQVVTALEVTSLWPMRE